MRPFKGTLQTGVISAYTRDGPRMGRRSARSALTRAAHRQRPSRDLAPRVASRGTSGDLEASRGIWRGSRGVWEAAPAQSLARRRLLGRVGRAAPSESPRRGLEA